MTRHRPLWYLVKASTRWLQESCFEHCNFTGAHHYKHNVDGRRPPPRRPPPPAVRRHQPTGCPQPVTTKWMVFTLNLTQDELILHTCKLLALFLLRGNIWLQLSKSFLEMTRSRTGHNVISREKICMYVFLAAGSVAIYGRFFCQIARGKY